MSAISRFKESVPPSGGGGPSSGPPHSAAPGGRTVQVLASPAISPTGSPEPDAAEPTAATAEALRALLRRAQADLERAETQVVQSAKLASLGRLAASVAHEINNPVSFIVSNMEPLRGRLDRLAGASHEDAARLLDEAKQIVAIMAKGAERTATIVQDLRTFAHLNETTRKTVDLREGLDVTIRLLEARWRERIVIHREYDELPAIECVPGQMNQVLMNVLANACDAIEERGEIWVRGCPAGDLVEVSVCDSGPGIPPEHLGRIFDAFFSTKDAAKGSGLGLSIAKRIVTAHGGRIDVESVPGTGTTVTIALPVAAMSRPPEPPA